MINCNDIVKMKIHCFAKEQLSQTPHYYLCWDKEDEQNGFLIFTSNFFKLFAKNVSLTKDVVLINRTPNLPFYKDTYIILNESFNIKNMTDSPNNFKVENAFNQEDFNKYRSRGKTAKQYNIKSYELK